MFSPSFHFKKNLGQNFLIDNNVVTNIVNNCPNITQTNVLEIGPGSGNLTKALLTKCKSLIAIEKDYALAEYLEQIKKNYNNFNYIIQDAIKTNIFNLIKQPAAIVANLPYNIGTLLFTKWLPYTHRLQYLVLMFQKEVALRITSKVNQPHYGRLSLFSQLYGKSEILFTVKPSSFKPSPLVDSAVIKFIPHHKPLNVNIEKFTNITKMAFSGRRKTIKVSLKSLNLNFEKLQINPQRRPQELTFEQFVLLSENI